jgi:hypothetical protein
MFASALADGFAGQFLQPGNDGVVLFAGDFFDELTLRSVRPAQGVSLFGQA